MTKNSLTEWHIEIAKRIACAVISYQAGVPYEDLWDQYAQQGENVGRIELPSHSRLEKVSRIESSSILC